LIQRGDQVVLRMLANVQQATVEPIIEAAVAKDIVPPRATAVPSETAETAPTQRGRHLHHIAEHGRMARQKASGYTRRALAEAAIGRWKQVIGDRLRAQTDECRATEVEVAVYTLNRMLDLGRLRSVEPPGSKLSRFGPRPPAPPLRCNRGHAVLTEAHRDLTPTS
jgi:hypothetical protein